MPVPAGSSPAARRAGPDAPALLVVALGLVARLCVAPSYGYLGTDADLIEHKQAMHLMLTRGIHEIYRASARNDPASSGRDWDGGYFTNQPPLAFYARALPVAAYRRLDPAGFDLWSEDLNYFDLQRTDLGQRLAASRGFTVALKLPGILADTAIALGLAVFARARSGVRGARLAAACYAFNPGVVFDTAFWGQHDAVAAGLVCASLVLLERGVPWAGWMAYTLACLAKPQAAALGILVLALGCARAGSRGLAAAALAVMGTLAAVFVPFAWHGTLGLSVTALWRSTLGGEPFVSCNAANLWWLLSKGRGYEVSDGGALVGFLTFRTVGMLAVLGLNLVVARRLLRAPERDLARTMLAAAIAALGFFMFATELHENHMMAVLPLLAFALPADRRIARLFGVLSLTFLLNMALFDPAVTEPLSAWLGRPVPSKELSLLAAGLNLAALGALLALFFEGGPHSEPAS